MAISGHLKLRRDSVTTHPAHIARPHHTTEDLSTSVEKSGVREEKLLLIRNVVTSDL